jgi:oligopeptidase B
MLGIVLAGGCSMNDSRTRAPKPIAQAQPPLAEQRPVELTAHGETRIDEFHWLRDDARTDPDVIAYLEAENAWAETQLAHLSELESELLGEMKARLPEADSTVPVRRGEDWYFERYTPGADYAKYMRHRGSEDGPEEILLDPNEEARAHDYYLVSDTAPSPDGQLFAWSEDTLSRELFTIRVKDTATGEVLPDTVADTTGSMAWSADGRHLFYVRRAPETLIPNRVYRHELGTDQAEDVLVYEETDNTFSISIQAGRDPRWILIGITSTLTTEYRFIDARRPETAPVVLIPRRLGHEYYPEPVGDWVYLRTNDGAPDFRLVRAPLSTIADDSSWDELVPPRRDATIVDFRAFTRFIALEERHEGLRKIRIQPLDGAESFYVPIPAAAYTASLAENPGVDGEIARFTWSSLDQPESVVDFDTRKREFRIRKRAQVAGYDPDEYETLRLNAPARDGARIPVSLYFRKGLRPDSSHGLFLNAYGSYGSSYDPDFKPERVSLVDRGMIFAIAHVRGGQELGRRWYEDGKLLEKKNTFTDFIDVTRFLVEEGWADPRRVIAQGRSAGGLLMGAIANLRPDLYAGIVAGVPFVDVVTTMLDESIPLTTFEFDEWGNPKKKTYYDYMLSYSPYDQVRAAVYPQMLVTAGLYDSRVQYWEPAKWVARLRQRAVGDSLLVLKTNMDTGHFDAAGRYSGLAETATEYAFVLDVAGLVD